MMVKKIKGNNGSALSENNNNNDNCYIYYGNINNDDNSNVDNGDGNIYNTHVTCIITNILLLLLKKLT